MPSPDLTSDSNFPSTSWTLVGAVQSGSPKEVARAMEDLCKSYWYPIYAFLRRSGRNVHDAEDLTQVLFQTLIDDAALLSARKEGGKLRSYLLAVLKRVISDQARHQSALKRGGGVPHLSFDELDAEDRYVGELQEIGDPQSAFDRAWAQEILSGVRGTLRTVFVTKGREALFDQLVPFLLWDNDPPSFRKLAGEIGSSEASARIQIHRLRSKFRELLRAEVAETVLSAEEIPGELAWLQEVLVEK